MESIHGDSCPVRMPLWFISHGPGPAWLLPAAILGPMLGKAHKDSSSANAMKDLVTTHPLPFTPKAVLVISAHWEAEAFTISTNSKPTLIYDYSGFPEESYKVKWAAPGPPREIVDRTKTLLQSAGIDFAEDSKRGLDHGVFVPLKLVFPEANLPVFQVSLKRSLNIREHLKLGEVLSELRNDGVFVVGSGHTTHNIHDVSMHVEDWAEKFRAWIHGVLTDPALSPAERKNKLLAADMEPTFKKAHPRSEHFLPMAVIAAAAGYEKGHIMYDEFIVGSLLCSHVKYN